MTGRDDGVTIAVPYCNACPPLRDWSEKALILGACPRCGRPAANCWRELRARRLVASALNQIMQSPEEGTP